MKIGGIKIGHDCLPFVIAEVSANHMGSFERAVELSCQAVLAGADAIKLQIFDPDRLAERRGGRDKVVTETLWSGQTLGDLYRAAHTPREWFEDLAAFHPGVFASAFDREDVEYLERFGCPAYKIASREAADVGLVSKAASTGKPLIISTGTATDDQLGLSIAAAAKHTNQIALLYCVSEYPTPMESIDFDEIKFLRRRFQLPVGFSDHTVGIEAAVEAVAAGACIIEKHITLSRADGGLDAAFSLEPHELKELVQRVKA